MANSDPLADLLAVLRDPRSAALAASAPGRWGQIKRQAERHGLSAVLAYLCSGYLPADQNVWWREVVAANFAIHRGRLRQLKAIVSALDEEGIRSVALKGPVLAERYLNPPFLKVSGDLDLLVDEANLQRACKCLERNGLRELAGPEPEWVRRRQSYDLKLMPSSSGLDAPVELHFRLIWQRAPFTGRDFLDRSEVWTGANGLRVRVLNKVDEAVFLAVHCAKHLFERLSWLYDALVVHRTLSPAERSQVVATARKAGQITRLAVANCAAVEFFQEPLIPDLTGVPAFPDIRRVAEWAIARMDSQRGGSISHLPWSERWQKRLLYLRYNFQMTCSPHDLLRVAESFVVLPLIRRGYALARRSGS